MKSRIVVVEDNSADVFLLKHALESAGLSCDLQYFEDGAKARDFIRAPFGRTPDLFLLDLNLPRVDGVHLLRLIRQQPSLDGIPVIVWSSSQSPTDQASLAEFNEVRFIAKPAGLDAFLRIAGIIRDVLHR